jgi:PAS domain S-box-containing protein
MSLERKIIDANPAMCKMFGYSLDEIVGQVPAMATYPEDYTRATQLFEDMMAGKRSSYFDERRFVRKNGEMFWGRITMSIVRDANGKPLYMVGMVLDVDEERLALAKLQESEARFKAIYENAPIGISLIGPNQKILAVNPALVRLSGRSEAELIKLGSQRITYPEDVNVGREEFVDVMQGKRESFQVEKRYVHKDGRVQWMRQSISAVRDATGSLVYLLSIAEDIDQQKRAVEELRESEARFRAMFENSAIGVLVLDVESLSVRANAAAGIILDNRHLERVLIDIHDFIHPDYQLAERPQLDELLNGKRDSFETEQWYCKSNGVCNCAHVTYSSVRASDGRLRYVVGMLQDITERKNAQDTLRESEARFRSMFDNAAVGVAVMTLDRHITQINQTATRLTGYSANEISKIDPSMLAVEEDRSIDQELFVELIEGKRDQYTVEKRYIRKDGEIFWGRVNFSAVRGADGKPLYTIGMIEDISKEKRAAEKLAAQDAKHRRMLEQRIAERTDELNRANELLREKAAQDAVTAERTRLARDLHDAVTQTLFSTTLIADVLPEIWEMNANEGKRRLEEVRQLTRGALAEMRTLLVELRPNALVEVPLPTLLRQLTEALIGRSRMNIQLSAEGERKLPADVQVGLYRVAQEALNNVVKHAHATQAVVTLRMGEVTRLTVQDNGAGFDPGTVTADHLGLKIMRERAEAIGAKYSIYSEPGEGTQISIVWEEKPSATKNTTPAPPGGARE